MWLVGDIRLILPAYVARWRHKTDIYSGVLYCSPLGILLVVIRAPPTIRTKILMDLLLLILSHWAVGGLVVVNNYLYGLFGASHHLFGRFGVSNQLFG